MILWNYLAECTSSKEAVFTAALCISSPFDPNSSMQSIERFIPRMIFNYHLANNLKALVKPHKALFNGLVDWKKVMSSRTIRDFDEAFTVPVSGYHDCAEYYRVASLYPKVDCIPIPTLCLNAADDCFSPLKSLPLSNIEKSKNVAMLLTRHGGHIGFLGDFNSVSVNFADQLIAQYVTVVTKKV